MPVPIILIFAGLGLAAAAALVFWEKIVEWGHDAVFPWFHKYFPTYEKWVREAFVVINKVAGNVRKAAIEAWRRIRPILLEQVVEWERTSDNKYVCKVISWMVKNLQEKKIDQTVIIKEVDPDDLPLEPGFCE